MTRFCWPATYVPAAAVMPKSSQRPASQTTTGTATVRNFAPTTVEVTDELMTTTCLPVASAAVEAASSATVTARPRVWQAVADNRVAGAERGRVADDEQGARVRRARSSRCRSPCPPAARCRD
jgi:hypothetical protein